MSQVTAGPFRNAHLLWEAGREASHSQDGNTGEPKTGEELAQMKTVLDQIAHLTLSS